MGISVEKQAVPIEFFEQVRTDEKLQALVDRLWGCGNGMFHWFMLPPFVPGFGQFPSPVEELKQDYKAAGEIWDRSFNLEEELEVYCALLEDWLGRMKADDPLILNRNVNLGRRTNEQVHSFLSEELKVRFPELGVDFATTVVFGGEPIKPESDLRYLSPDQVNTINHVLSQIQVDELLCHFDASTYDPNYWLEECRQTIQQLKTCIAETAERQQVILTKII